MNSVPILLTESEARQLYRLIHQLEQGQDDYSDLYGQLQRHFFQSLTIEEIHGLLGESAP